MLTPSFEFKVGGKEYSVSPTFGLQDDIEKALKKTLFSVLVEAEESCGFTVSELFAIYKLLPCKADMTEDPLKEWIALNRNEANRQLSELIIFLVMPQKQADQVKKK